MRWNCTVDGLTDTWIEIDDRWTRRETEQLDATNDEAYFDLLRAKTLACHVQVSDGAITDPAGLTLEGLLDADEAVIGFLGRVLVHTVAQRRFLGNASLRLSSTDKGAMVAAMAKTIQATTNGSQERQTA